MKWVDYAQNDLFIRLIEILLYYQFCYSYIIIIIDIFTGQTVCYKDHIKAIG